VLRILRRRLPLRPLSSMLDLLFWIAVSQHCFSIRLTRRGVLRIYMRGRSGRRHVYFSVCSRFSLRFGFRPRI
jgi:hypothetical protein